VQVKIVWLGKDLFPEGENASSLAVHTNYFDPQFSTQRHHHRTVRFRTPDCSHHKVQFYLPHPILPEPTVSSRKCGDLHGRPPIL
jgi:hypothetical protein